MLMEEQKSKVKVGLWIDHRWNHQLERLSSHMGLRKGDVVSAAVALFMQADHEQRKAALQQVIGDRFDEVATQAEAAAQEARTAAEQRQRGTRRSRPSSA